MFVIQLESKHHGGTTHLGVRFSTREEARAFADKEVCPRCNRVEIYEHPDDWRWVNRDRGFAPERQ